MKRYRITDDVVADLLCFYCEGKSAVWNWFFDGAADIGIQKGI